jgi:hypothetical protein
MSRLWEHQEFRPKSCTDQFLEGVDGDLGGLADSYATSADVPEDGPARRSAIVADLRRRAEQGVRFWPESASGMQAREPDAGDPITDDDIPW